jgi:hypothetical protein
MYCGLPWRCRAIGKKTGKAIIEGVWCDRIVFEKRGFLVVVVGERGTGKVIVVDLI